MQNLEEHQIPNGRYGFSAAKIDDLDGASEYTLVTIVMDESGSTSPFKDKLENCIKEIVMACRKNPRADYLMLRLVAFGSGMREVHGFKLLQNCNPGDYDGCYSSNGATALFDSCENAVSASRLYAEKLFDSDYNVNGIVIVVTDGDDNVSKNTANQVKDALELCVNSEKMESLVSILVGVNLDANLQQYLDDFYQKANFTQYVPIDNADAKSIAKLANFISQSISSQSQAIGSGGPSQSLTF